VVASGLAPRRRRSFTTDTLPLCAAECTHVYPSPSPPLIFTPCAARSSKIASCPSMAPCHVAQRWLAA
jgi:hypothetical protein